MYRTAALALNSLLNTECITFFDGMLIFQLNFQGVIYRIGSFDNLFLVWTDHVHCRQQELLKCSINSNVNPSD